MEFFLVASLAILTPDLWRAHDPGPLARKALGSDRDRLPIGRLLPHTGVDTSAGLLGLEKGPSLGWCPGSGLKTFYAFPIAVVLWSLKKLLDWLEHRITTTAQP